jgi:methylenetetrahydrofolate dehydrogenase (NADP+)/methenyltetrahydrofolate cyclohydrolase
VTARILDGAGLARRMNEELALRVADLPRPPGLAVVLVGEDPASQIYVRNKGKVAEKLGFRHWQISRPADLSEADLLAIVAGLNADAEVDGILVQLPLPKHIDPQAVIDAIDPAKDVDGFTPTNTGLLSLGRPSLVACTPAGCRKILEDGAIQLSGAEAVVIGRSNIVGRPMARLLELANCTVTLAHSRTRDLAAHVRRAQVVVAAVGIAELVRGDWVSDGAVVIDVGMNRLPSGKLAGDVAFSEVVERAGAITPVPGGVGPMTIAMLAQNTFESARRRLSR